MRWRQADAPALPFGDIFSLGRILQELYTGERGVEVPAGDLRRVIMRATAPRPQDRHRSVAEYIADLERAIVPLGDTGWESPEEIAQRHLQRLRFQDTSSRELDEYLDWALTLDPDDPEDGPALTTVFPALGNPSIADLWARRPTELREAFRAHCSRVSSVQYGFASCDVLADFARRMVRQTRDPDILRRAVASLIELGAHHNRWHVQGVVTGILQGLREADEIDAAIDGLHANIAALAWTIADFSLRSLAPQLRKAITDLGIDSS